VEAARAQLLLEHEQSAGSTAHDEGSRLSAALAEERRGRQRVAQELAAERALRSRAEESGSALQREVASRRREVELAAQQRVQLEAELQLARTEASEAAGVREFAEGAQREREALHREQRERANFERQQAQLRRGGPGGAPPVNRLPRVSFAEGGAGLGTTRDNPYADEDELGRSDLWDFSSGKVARGGGAGGKLSRNQGPSISLPHIKGAVA